MLFLLSGVALLGGGGAGLWIYQRGSSTRPQPAQDVRALLGGDELSYEDVWWFDQVGRMSEAVRQTDPRVIFIGDSIVKGWEEQGKEIWEDVFLPLGTLNLGIVGDRTEHVLWRLERLPLERLEPEAVVILIGVNNIPVDSPSEVADGVMAVADLVRGRLPETPILLLAIFPGWETPGSFRDRIAATNRILAERVGGTGFIYLDLTERFIEPDGRILPSIMWDGLHLTETGYERWAQGLAPALGDLLGEAVEP